MTDKNHLTFDSREGSVKRADIIAEACERQGSANGFCLDPRRYTLGGRTALWVCRLNCIILTVCPKLMPLDDKWW
jgi:hypothetical protein